MVQTLLLALACSTPPGDAPVTILHQDIVTATETVTVPTTTTETVVEPIICPGRPSGTICTYAGIPHVAMFSPDGLDRRETSLYVPNDVAVSPLDGRLYIVEANNHRIRDIAPDATVETVAGTGFLGAGIYDDVAQEWTDGPALDFAFDAPVRLSFDAADPEFAAIGVYGNQQVDLLGGGWVRYLAGSRAPVPADPDGDGIFLALDADLGGVSGVAWDDAGDLFIRDEWTRLIQEVLPDGSISRFAGALGAPIGFAGDGGDALAAVFAMSPYQVGEPPGGMAVHDGGLYVPDTANQVIRRIDLTTHVIATVAGHYSSTGVYGIDVDGDGDYDQYLGDPGYAGDGGPATDASLNQPVAVAFDAEGDMFIADYGNHCVREVDPTGILTTFAGICDPTRWTDPTLDLGDGGDPLDATFNHPTGVAVDADGNVFVADSENQVVRVIWK